MVELNDAVTAAAAFLGGYLGQRHAGAKVKAEVAALASRVDEVEARAKGHWAKLIDLHHRLFKVERREA